MFSIEIDHNLITQSTLSCQQCLLDGQKTGTVLCACPLLMDDFHGFANPSTQGYSAMSSNGLGSMVGGVVGGVVGGEAGWKLFNEGSSLVEEGVVIFVTHQNALVVWNLQIDVVKC